MAFGFLGPQTSHLPRSLNLADAASQKISEIGAGKAVQLTFSDKGSDKYLFIGGTYRSRMIAQRFPTFGASLRKHGGIPQMILPSD